MTKNIRLEDFPLITFDKIRYGDTDRQGHVNNASFATFLETGRAELFYNEMHGLLPEGASFVVANINLNLLGEIFWPGKVDIGTGVAHIGNSSIKVLQHIYYNGKCVATAETINVQVKNNKSLPLSSEVREALKRWFFDV
ncbi:MAG TPA: thioesterase family protein [Bacteroidales bacterium]|nr:thioesterase family protein [Bacteroidales bacterium]